MFGWFRLWRPAGRFIADLVLQWCSFRLRPSKKANCEYRGLALASRPEVLSSATLSQRN